MDTEILNQLELIRIYVFIIMFAIVAWAAFKIVQSVKTIYIGFNKSWDTAFCNRIDKYFDLGNYQEIVDECEELLKKYPCHADATWYLARAYFGLNKQPEAIKYFNRLVELKPGWKESADEYIEAINERLSIHYKQS